MTQKVPRHLYKILTREEWEQSARKKEIVRGPNDTTFIHLSTEEQLTDTIERKFKDIDHVVLKIDVSKLPGSGRLEHELYPKNGQKYWHLYHAEIPHEAVDKREEYRASL